MASIIDEVVFLEGSDLPPDALRRRLAEDKGKPLTGKGYLALLWAAAGNLPNSSSGVRLWAVRDGDDTGVTLRVKLTKGKPVDDAGGLRVRGPGWQGHLQDGRTIL